MSQFTPADRLLFKRSRVISHQVVPILTPNSLPTPPPPVHPYHCPVRPCLPFHSPLPLPCLTPQGAFKLPWHTTGHFMLCSYILPGEPGPALIFGVWVQVPELGSPEAAWLHPWIFLSQNFLKWAMAYLSEYLVDRYSFRPFGLTCLWFWP